MARIDALSEMARVEGQAKIRADELSMTLALQKQSLADSAKLPSDAGAIARMTDIRVQAEQAGMSQIQRIETDASKQVFEVWAAEYEALSKLPWDQARIVGEADAAIQAIEAEKASRIAEINRQAYGKMEQQVSSFIDRVFLHAKSLKDVLDQLWTQMLDSFVKRLVTPMVANWLTGMNQMQTGAASGGRGILGGLMATLFGISASAGTSYAAAGAGGGSVTSAFGSYNGITALPLSMPSGLASSGGVGTVIGSGGQVIAGGVTVPTGGASTSMLARLLAELPMFELAGALGGGMLAYRGFKSGSPLEGAAGGALAGFSLGGPIGAALGAWVGTILGFLGRGAAKEKATSLFQQYQEQERDLYHKYQHHEVEYDSAVSGEEQIGTAGDYALTHAGLGKWGRRGAENLDSQTAMYLAAIEKIQDQRDTRTDLIGAMTVPEFSEGGFAASVLRRADGHQLAWIKPEEFVFRPEATRY